MDKRKTVTTKTKRDCWFLSDCIEPCECPNNKRCEFFWSDALDEALSDEEREEMAMGRFFEGLCE